jgi:hypothetical protein
MSNEVKTLPDSPGWWLREGDDPVQVINIVADALKDSMLRFVSGGRSYPPKPGRWLKVELPTFPQREKAPFRLCWASFSKRRTDNQSGRYLFSHCVEDEYFDCHLGGRFSADDLTHIEWVSAEFLDELSDPRATEASGS